MYEPDDFFYGDADIEQAQLEAAGRDHSRRVKRALQLKSVGRYDEAARTCPHGGSTLLSTSHATYPDCRCCCDCGSVIDESWPPRVIAPCVEGR